jgi:phosphatidylserine decarboxylase
MNSKEMVRDGIYYAAALIVAGLGLTYVASWLVALPLFLLAVFCLYFFRDPNRTVPDGAVAVSPADGRVVSVKAMEPNSTRVSIFLNIFDVHVNRTPIAGRITDVEYQPGRFLVASREDASLNNEQNVVTVEGDGTRVVFKQIAGLIARRIVCWKKTGDVVRAGERIGLIKFGSRVDVFFGPEWEVTVNVRERVSGGSSVIARRKREQ